MSCGLSSPAALRGGYLVGRWTIDQIDKGKVLKTRKTRQFAHTWTHFAFWCGRRRGGGVVERMCGERRRRRLVLVLMLGCCRPSTRPARRRVPFVPLLQGRNRCWYAGAYTLINTHEIAVMSGLAAADRLVRAERTTGGRAAHSGSSTQRRLRESPPAPIVLLLLRALAPSLSPPAHRALPSLLPSAAAAAGGALHVRPRRARQVAVRDLLQGGARVLDAPREEAGGAAGGRGGDRWWRGGTREQKEQVKMLLGAAAQRHQRVGAAAETWSNSNRKGQQVQQ